MNVHLDICFKMRLVKVNFVYLIALVTTYLSSSVIQILTSVSMMSWRIHVIAMPIAATLKACSHVHVTLAFEVMEPHVQVR